MSDLDSKLREILVLIAKDAIKASKATRYWPEFPASEAIAQIKQAFADEGYVEINGRGISPTNSIQSPTNNMTGREWEKAALAKGWRPPND